MKINTTQFAALVSWHVEEKSDELDATTAADAGYAHPDVGIIGATITLKGVLNIMSGVYSPIRTSTAIALLNLYRESTDTVAAFAFPNAICVQSNQGAENRGRFEIGATIKSIGTYTYNEPS